MGFENRDYLRNDAERTWSLELAPGCRVLIIINIVVFLLQIFVTRPAIPADFGLPDDVEINFRLPQVSTVQELGELDVDRTISGGQVWRLITHAFLHSRQSLWHIAFNMLVLWAFGQEVEKIRGTKEFLTIYLMGALVAGLAYVGMCLYLKSNIPAIGASGAVQTIFMVYVMHYPRNIITIFFILPIEARYAMALFILYDLHPVLLQLSGDRVFSGVAHIAHLGGAAFGYLYCRNDWRLSTWLPERSTARTSRPRPVIDRPTIRLNEAEQDRLDALLEKISKHGKDSLTAAEREELVKASARIRRNRS